LNDPASQKVEYDQNIDLSSLTGLGDFDPDLNQYFGPISPSPAPCAVSSACTWAAETCLGDMAFKAAMAAQIPAACPVAMAIGMTR
jgi:hypothetical protein